MTSAGSRIDSDNDTDHVLNIYVDETEKNELDMGENNPEPDKNDDDDKDWGVWADAMDRKKLRDTFIEIFTRYIGDERQYEFIFAHTMYFTNAQIREMIDDNFEEICRAMTHTSCGKDFCYDNYHETLGDKMIEFFITHHLVGQDVDGERYLNAKEFHSKGAKFKRKATLSSLFTETGLEDVVKIKVEMSDSIREDLMESFCGVTQQTIHHFQNKLMTKQAMDRAKPKAKKEQKVKADKKDQEAESDSDSESESESESEAESEDEEEDEDKDKDKDKDKDEHVDEDEQFNKILLASAASCQVSKIIFGFYDKWVKRDTKHRSIVVEDPNNRTRVDKSRIKCKELLEREFHEHLVVMYGKEGGDSKPDDDNGNCFAVKIYMRRRDEDFKAEQAAKNSAKTNAEKGSNTESKDTVTFSSDSTDQETKYVGVPMKAPYEKFRSTGCVFLRSRTTNKKQNKGLTCYHIIPLFKFKVFKKIGECGLWKDRVYRIVYDLLDEAIYAAKNDVEDEKRWINKVHKTHVRNSKTKTLHERAKRNVEELRIVSNCPEEEAKPQAPLQHHEVLFFTKFLGYLNKFAEDIAKNTNTYMVIEQGFGKIPIDGAKNSDAFKFRNSRKRHWHWQKAVQLGSGSDYARGHFHTHASNRNNQARNRTTDRAKTFCRDHARGQGRGQGRGRRQNGNKRDFRERNFMSQLPSRPNDRDRSNSEIPNKKRRFDNNNVKSPMLNITSTCSDQNKNRDRNNRGNFRGSKDSRIVVQVVENNQGRNFFRGNERTDDNNYSSTRNNVDFAKLLKASASNSPYTGEQGQTFQAPSPCRYAVESPDYNPHRCFSPFSPPSSPPPKDKK